MGMETKVKVHAFMTAARYENSMTRNHIEIALKALGIPMQVSGGVFYGQCMQNMLHDALKYGIDYAITIDGDSMFTHKHIERLLGVIVRPDSGIDALAALQCKRGCHYPLASCGEQTLRITGEPFKASTAHFGLTVLDMRKLAMVPLPWFADRPGPDGTWTHTDKIDADISFWKAWGEAGNSLYMDPGCSIGHMEEMITVFDEQMQVKHLYPKEWRAMNGYSAS
jgi:hypothetical protein